MSDINYLEHIALSGLKYLVNYFSPMGKRAALLVLTYHRVLNKPDPLLPDDPDVEQFTQQIDAITSVFNVLSLKEAVERLAGGSLPPRALCLTFDDGYENNYTLAAPVLAKKGIPATIFVSTGFINSGVMWNDSVIEFVRYSKNELDLSQFDLGFYILNDDQDRLFAVNEIIKKMKYLHTADRDILIDSVANYLGYALPKRLMMSEDQISGLPKLGIQVGAHTVSHPILSTLRDEESRREILYSKTCLEDILREKVEAFAYPNGRVMQDFNKRHVEIVKELGFKCAVTTDQGICKASTDLFQMPRIAPWGKNTLGYLGRAVKSYMQ